jgi:hypothetical protein
MSIFTSKKNKLEKEEKELRNKFFTMYGSAKEMIESQNAKVSSDDKNLLMEVSNMCEEKDSHKVG